MKEVSTKIGLSVGLQGINLAAIYLAIQHIGTVQNGSATTEHTLFIIAGLFLLSKVNFIMSKYLKINNSSEKAYSAQQ